MIHLDEKGPTAEPNIVSIRREITIEDRNDNPPKFSEPSYLFTVNETVGLNTQVFNKILISDADSGSNGEIKLTCLKQVLTLAIVFYYSPVFIASSCIEIT